MCAMGAPAASMNPAGLNLPDLEQAATAIPATGVAPVSVVVPCYRCEATIAAAVASIAAQTLPPAEVLLVDDASGDGTLASLHRLAAQYPGWIRVIANARNGGPSCARNAGWREATQEYIAFLDADDSWAPRKLELQVQALRADPGIALIAHRMQVRDRALGAPSLRPPVRLAIVSRRRLLLNNPFPTASVVLRRDLPFRFNEGFRRVEDFLLWAQIAFSGYRCAKLDQVLAVWHKPTYGASGLTADLAAMHRAGRAVRLELLRQGLVTRSEHAFARAVGLLRRGRRRLLLAVRRLMHDGSLP
jgi:glycosyltransferase involved in cell wall biosynthesis